MVVIRVGLLFVLCDFFFFTVGSLVFLGPALFLSLALTSCPSSLPSLSVLSSASETSAVWVSAPFDVAAWDVWIAWLGSCGFAACM